MSAVRSSYFNRINVQIALLILIALLAIHAIITASILISRRIDDRAHFRDDAAELVSALRLLAVTPPVDRARLIGQFAWAFPDLRLSAANTMPASSGDADRPLHFLASRLGKGFQLAAQPIDPKVAVGNPNLALAARLPDGAVITAQLRMREPPPFLGGPVASTILFLVLSITLLGLWASFTLGKPLKALSRAAEGFNLDGEPAPLPEQGPMEIRAVAQSFNRMHERIRRLVDDRTRLLSAMGHDLRTPITRLRLRCEFIADEELRRQMLRDLDQMKAMTEDVLSFLRDGQPRGGATTVDITSLLQTICDQFTDMGFNVAYEGPDHATAVARLDDVQRAVTNLTDNATRHAAHVVVRLSTDPAEIRIDVEDDGPGIPDDRKNAMLEAFTRGEEARTMDDRAGFGLGLSIARAIAEAHGGRLTLHDRVPQGLVARITLPARVSADGAQAA